MTETREVTGCASCPFAQPSGDDFGDWALCGASGEALDVSGYGCALLSVAPPDCPLRAGPLLVVLREDA